VKRPVEWCGFLKISLFIRICAVERSERRPRQSNTVDTVNEFIAFRRWLLTKPATYNDPRAGKTPFARGQNLPKSAVVVEKCSRCQSHSTRTGSQKSGAAVEASSAPNHSATRNALPHWLQKFPPVKTYEPLVSFAQNQSLQP
jgi:hypothetical protein